MSARRPAVPPCSRSRASSGSTPTPRWCASRSRSGGPSASPDSTVEAIATSRSPAVSSGVWARSTRRRTATRSWRPAGVGSSRPSRLNPGAWSTTTSSRCRSASRARTDLTSTGRYRGSSTPSSSCAGLPQISAPPGPGPRHSGNGCCATELPRGSRRSCSTRPRSSPRRWTTPLGRAHARPRWFPRRPRAVDREPRSCSSWASPPACGGRRSTTGWRWPSAISIRTSSSSRTRASRTCGI